MLARVRVSSRFTVTAPPKPKFFSCPPWVKASTGAKLLTSSRLSACRMTLWLADTALLSITASVRPAS